MRPRLLRAQNQQGYLNSTPGIATASDATKGVSAKAALKSGSPTSSKANINVARFDTVPLIRFAESSYWFGIPDKEEN
jgi:hypothetical protein